MAQAAVAQPTLYEQLVALPETVVGEILAGRLIVSPRPTPRHLVCGSVLGGQLVDPFHRGARGPGGWWLLDEPELHLADDVVVPDMAGWRRSRMPTLPTRAWFCLAPDWVCEILSPSSEHTDRVIKRDLYGRAGVDWFWLIDPDRQSIEVLGRHDAAWATTCIVTGHTSHRLPPFDAIALDLGALWAG